jgi:hypothetical protein
VTKIAREKQFGPLECIFMGEPKTSSERETKKGSVPTEIKYFRMIDQVKNLSIKLMNLSKNHRTAAYWEQVIEDCEEFLKAGPLA